MRTLRSARIPLLLLIGFVTVMTLVLSACQKTEPTDGLGDGSAPKTSEGPSGAPPVGTGSEAPVDTGDLTDIDVDALTADRWYAAERGDPFLEFTPEGAVTGTDGCNTISTTWSGKDGKITLKSFSTTQKACSGVEPWLGKASSLELNGDTITVFDVQGKELGELQKVDK